MNKENKYAILTGIFLLIIYYASAYDATITNDSFTNIEQVKAMDIWHRSSHFGFHFLSVLFYAGFKYAGLDNPIMSTQVMLSFFSVAGALSLFRIVLLWKNKLPLAISTVILYSLNSNIWRFSAQNEYHVLIPSLSLIAIGLWLHRKYFAGAAFAGLALLTSPFAIFSFPLIFIKPLEINKKIILQSLAGIILVAGSVSMFTFKETVTGEWSYNLVFQYYKKTLSATNYLRVIGIYLYGYFRAFHLILPFVALFIFRYFRTEKRLWIICILTLIMHLPAAVPENRYGAYQMTLYPVLALATAFVIQRLFENGTWKKALIFTAFFLFNFYIVFQERDYHQSLSKMYTQMQNDSTIEDQAYVFMYKATRPFTLGYAPRLQGVSVYSGYLENMTENLENYELPDYSSLLKSRYPVYLIESGVSLPDDYLKSVLAEFTNKQGAKLMGTGIKKIRQICPEASFEEKVNYPFKLYKVHCPS